MILADVEIEIVRDGAILKAIDEIAESAADYHGKAACFTEVTCSKEPDYQKRNDPECQSRQDQGPPVPEIAQQTESDPTVETEHQVERGKDRDHLWRVHDEIYNRPLGKQIGCREQTRYQESDHKSAASRCGRFVFDPIHCRVRSEP